MSIKGIHPSQAPLLSTDKSRKDPQLHNLRRPISTFPRGDRERFVFTHQGSVRLEFAIANSTRKVQGTKCARITRLKMSSKEGNFFFCRKYVGAQLRASDRDASPFFFSLFQAAGRRRRPIGEREGGRERERKRAIIGPDPHPKKRRECNVPIPLYFPEGKKSPRKMCV